ncbi:glycoside hydrolase family 16 protein [Kitasatospora sp. MAP5-34]|uniref:glycoside hydrolase family 16 protein n=1 Tax=Kitasatospora sp. MAP5-34 TaxID=3035102 RepID=UPI0024754711|nr:glycoside hydrolase family 16 protein [Kitasatospora sp. MAP5-34]
MRTPPQVAWRLLLALSGWAALLCTTLQPANPLRVAVTGAFVLGCPGAAAMLLARPAPTVLVTWPDRLAAVVLAVALSAAIAAVTAEGFFLRHVFTTGRALVALACLTTVLALLPRRLRAGSQRSVPAKVRPPASAAGPRREQFDRRVGYLTGAGLLLFTAACSSGVTGTTNPGPGTGVPRSASPPPEQPAAPGQWHSVFRDDFNGTALNTRDWATCYDWNNGGCTNSGNAEKEWYQPGQVQVTGGELVLTAQRRTTQGHDGRTYPWTSGMVTTGRDSWEGTPRHTFTYGYYAAAIQVPARAEGMFPAFWLIPAESRSAPPELDVAEFINSNQIVDMNLHWPTAGGDDAHVGRTYGPADFATGYHVFGLDWEPDAVTWYVDGVQRFQVTDPSRLPHVAMELVINLAVGFQHSPPSSVDSAQLHVDWVGVWQH